MEKRNVKVSAVMTAPRHEIVLARNWIEKAMKRIGIPMTISGGVFYGQCMQKMFVDLVEQDIDYVLTVDFDSMFTAKHVQRLLDIISHTEGVDAIAAIQPKRGDGTILAARDKEEQLKWDGAPVQVKSAHFGLTVIDIQKLKTVPKPWFWAHPNADGDWEGTKIDDDVWFWKQWHEAGLKVFIDPGCRLGHLEEMVTVYDSQMHPVHLYPREWSDFCDSAVD